MGARRGRRNRILATCSYSNKYPAGGSRWNLLPFLSPTVLWMYSWLSQAQQAKVSPNDTIMTMRRVLRSSLGGEHASCPQWWNRRLHNGTSSGSPSRSALPIQPLPSSGAGTSMSSVCGTPLLAAAWGNSSLVTIGFFSVFSAFLPFLPSAWEANVSFSSSFGLTFALMHSWLPDYRDFQVPKFLIEC